ncbi:uncharacterized protein LOC134209337 [Armigeres subalbatus]|uniref:uncharacterized protein LOC134209337 n=1 Tax=Armigeres subalbatus TaxID=124917 RepID=UPI002ED0DB67
MKSEDFDRAEMCQVAISAALDFARSRSGPRKFSGRLGKRESWLHPKLHEEPAVKLISRNCPIGRKDSREIRIEFGEVTFLNLRITVSLTFVRTADNSGRVLLCSCNRNSFFSIVVQKYSVRRRLDLCALNQSRPADGYISLPSARSAESPGRKTPAPVILSGGKRSVSTSLQRGVVVVNCHHRPNRHSSTRGSRQPPFIGPRGDHQSPTDISGNSSADTSAVTIW